MTKLAVIQQQFGPAAYQDFLRVINAPPKFQQQVNEYLGGVRNGTLVLGTEQGAKATYDRSLEDTGTNTIGGRIAFSTTNSNYNGLDGASLGYHLAEAFAHELGHAFDAGLGSTAWQAAGTAGGATAQTVLGVKSEAKAALNAIEMMTEARAGLISAAAAALDTAPLPFDKDNWRVSTFAGLERGLRGMTIGTASNDLAATCTIDDACLSMAMNYMGSANGGNYYESIYRSITGNPSATFPAQLKVLNENEDYKTVVDANDPNRLNVVDKNTGEVVQTIDVQIFDDGTALLMITDRDGSTHAVAVENSGESLQTTTNYNFQGDTTKIITKSYDTEGQLAGTITGTPDGVGGMNRVVETSVNGKAVVITQYASLSDLDEDSDGDGNGLDAGDYTTTGITIGGQAAVNAGILGAALDDLYAGDALSMLGDNNSGMFIGMVNAGDATNTAGTVAPVTTGTGGSNTGPAWYETDTAQKWGGSLTHVQILLAAMKSGKPLPLATSYFNLASHLARHVLLDAAGNPVLGIDGKPQYSSGLVGDISTGLNLLGSVIGVHDAFKSGGNDLGKIMAVGSYDTAANDGHYKRTA